MPFPVAAAIAYGAIAGGGLVGAAAAIQRIWRYFGATPDEQDAEDERMTPVIQALASAIAQARFGMTINGLSTDDRRSVESEAREDAPRFMREMNAASEERYDKPFSELTRTEREALFRWLAAQY